MSAVVADKPAATISRKLPPSERDFEIYEAVHVGNASTWSQAEKHEISQTRVRQIIRRVVEWLGEVLPPQAKIAREQEVHLARQIAASRYQHQLEEATAFWNETRELKYAGLRIRLTTAQARLGVVGGIIDGLAADAIEGIPVPVWQAPAENDDKENTESAPEEAGGIRKAWLPPAELVPKQRRRTKIEMPHELWDPLTEDEITPEIVAARAAWGCPIHPNLIQFAKERGRAWRRAEAEKRQPAPPVEDFSDADDDSPVCNEPPQEPADETPTGAEACDRAAADPDDASADECPASQPLLGGSNELPVTKIQVTPNEPGATISRAENVSAVRSAPSVPCPSRSNLPALRSSDTMPVPDA